jgi:3-methyladenine DNA glycosylase AlkD
MEAEEIICLLRSHGNPAAVAGMAGYGITTDRAYGVTVPQLRKLAKSIGTDRTIAEALWRSGAHEARILASMVMPARELTNEIMERWVRDFDSWDLCDQCCNNLFRKTPAARAKAVEWHARPEEFVRRAGFVLMACLAVHDKAAPDDVFRSFLAHIGDAEDDERNFVKKAANWALRQIGKRNAVLNRAAIETAESLQKRDSKSSRWIASNALRELRSSKVHSKWLRAQKR